MSNSKNSNSVIPAETPILTFPLRGGRYDCFLSRKRERIEVRAAGIQRLYLICFWALFPTLWGCFLFELDSRLRGNDLFLEVPIC